MRRNDERCSHDRGTSLYTVTLLPHSGSLMRRHHDRMRRRSEMLLRRPAGGRCALPRRGAGEDGRCILESSGSVGDLQLLLLSPKRSDTETGCSVILEERSNGVLRCCVCFLGGKLLQHASSGEEAVAESIFSTTAKSIFSGLLKRMQPLPMLALWSASRWASTTAFFMMYREM